MAHVTVTILGRKYRLNCGDGEEEHLKQLAQNLDQRIDGLRKGFGDIGEMQVLVMAGLMLVDELAEVREQARGTGQTGAPTGAVAAGDAAGSAVAAALNAAAERIEQVTKSLNRSLGDGVPVG